MPLAHSWVSNCGLENGMLQLVNVNHMLISRGLVGGGWDQPIQSHGKGCGKEIVPWKKTGNLPMGRCWMLAWLKRIDVSHKIERMMDFLFLGSNSIPWMNFKNYKGCYKGADHKWSFSSLWLRDYVGRYYKEQIIPNFHPFLQTLFIIDRAESSLLLGLFSSCGEWRLLSSCGVQASHCGGLPHCGAQSLGVWASVVVVPGL